MIVETCSAEFRQQGGDHPHGCDDYPDHSAGSHHCGECGLLWGGPPSRCCLCRMTLTQSYGELEPTDLPGTGWRCTDHDGCRERVRATIAAHVGLAEVCE